MEVSSSATKKKSPPLPDVDKPRRPSEDSKGSLDEEELKGVSPLDSPVKKAATRMLDELFRKTTTTPCIYWLPLTDAEVELALSYSYNPIPREI